MNKGFTPIKILLLMCLPIAFAQQSNGRGSVYNSEVSLDTENRAISNENRLPDLLKEAKILLSDAFISDVMNDTLEVVYNLNRIFDLLSEADQYGEMDDEDKDEFDRFEESLVSLYTKRFDTLDKVDASLTAESMRMDVTSRSEPLEVEMGATQLLLSKIEMGIFLWFAIKKLTSSLNILKPKVVLSLKYG